MTNKPLILIVILFSFIILSFFIWHFFLSVYEVKIIHDKNSNELNYNSTINIHCVAVNSIGWNLTFRDTQSRLILLEGHHLFSLVDNSDKNKFIIKTKGESGNFSIKIESNLALNPTILSFRINE